MPIAYHRVEMRYILPTMLRALLLLVLVAGCPASRQPPPADTPVRAASEDDARAVVEKWRQAWEMLSVDALKPLYDQGLDVTVVVQGRAHQGWQAVELHLSTAVGAMKEARLRLEDLRSVTLGDGAVLVIASLSRDISDGVSYVTDRGTLMTLLRAQADGSWRIVAEHYSYPPNVQ
jgi:uncharacterized protein (TIGR02246 family)